MAERALDARSSIALLRHRWPVLVVTGLAGAVLGVLYAVVVPIELTSTSLVLLPAAAQSPTGGGTDIDTQVRLVQSRPVLEEAGREVRPALSGTQVAKRVSADGATSQLIEIMASSSRADQAQALSQAVAKAYVAVVTNNARSVTGATLGELRDREKLLRTQIQALQDQIGATRQRKGSEDPNSAAGRRDAQLLAQLTVDQADASLEWEQVKKELAAGTAAGLASPAVIVQSAAPATGPGVLSYFFTCALVGALLAAALGAVGLLVKIRRDPRLRTRDDIADAVGSTVLAEVRSRPQRSVAAWSTLFQFYEASAVDAWAFRQVLRALSTSADQPSWLGSPAKRTPGRLEHPRSVTVVSFAGDGRGLAVAAQLASFAASLGIATRFVAAGGHTNAPSLWAACSSDRASRLRPGLGLDVSYDEHDEGANARPLPPPAETLDELLEDLLAGRTPRGARGTELPYTAEDDDGGWEISEQAEDDLEVDPDVDSEDDFEDDPEVEAQVDPDVDSEDDLEDDPEVEAQVDPEVDSEDDLEDDLEDDPEVEAQVDPEVDSEDDLEDDPEVEAQVDPEVDSEDDLEDDPEVEAQVDPEVGEPIRSDGAVRATTAVVEHEPASLPASPTETLTPEPVVPAAPKHVLAELTVVLAVVDRRSPTLSRIPETSVTVLAISPGAATTEDLARLAVAVDDSDRRIDGIIVADPDPADATTGRRTLNDRALEPPLPLRTTGVSRLPWASGGREKGR